MPARRSASNSYSRRSGTRVHQGVSAIPLAAVSGDLADSGGPAAVDVADGLDGADVRVCRPSDSSCLPPLVVLGVNSRTDMNLSIDANGWALPLERRCGPQAEYATKYVTCATRLTFYATSNIIYATAASGAPQLMEHFAIIQALCRAAMANPSD